MLKTNSTSKLSVLSLVALSLLSACGGGSDTPPKPVQTGILMDSAVSGAGYTTKTQSGITGDAGKAGSFRYLQGEDVTFTLGNMQLGTARAGSKVFLDSIKEPGKSAPDALVSTRIGQLLQSLDSDGNPANGITLKRGLDTARLGKLNFTQGSQAEYDKALAAALQKVGITSMVTAKAARAHMDKTSPVDAIAPTVNVEQPAAAHSSTAYFTLSGTVQDNRERNRPKTIAFTQGKNTKKDIALDSKGGYSIQMPLMAGANNYTITARDTAGNVTEIKGSVYFGNKLAAGGSHTGAIHGGKLYTWGRNNIGQSGKGFTSYLKDGATRHPKTPSAIQTPASFVSLAFSQNHSLAIDDKGKLWSWGDDSDGQLGQGDAGRDDCSRRKENCRLTIGQVSNLTDVVSVVAGYDHVLALKADGTVWAFGSNSAGQLGDGSTSKSSSMPVQVKWAESDKTRVGKIVQLSASSKSSYALDDKGQVWGWGRDYYANLGLGKRNKDRKARQATPVLIPNLDKQFITSVATGRDHVLALTKEGKVFAWGLNFTSQIGYRGYKYKGKGAQAGEWEGFILKATELPAFKTKPAVQVYANGNTSFARRADGKVYHWGMYGEMNGNRPKYSNLDEPEDKLPALKGVVDMAVGGLHQIAQTKDGKIYNWGWSFEGSLAGGESTQNIWMYNVLLEPGLPALTAKNQP